MKKSFQIGSAFVGLIVGAGFASGQEVMQYFTSFGIWGTVGGIIATPHYDESLDLTHLVQGHLAIEF